MNSGFIVIERFIYPNKSILTFLGLCCNFFRNLRRRQTDLFKSHFHRESQSDDISCGTKQNSFLSIDGDFLGIDDQNFHSFSQAKRSVTSLYTCNFELSGGLSWTAIFFRYTMSEHCLTLSQGKSFILRTSIIYRATYLSQSSVIPWTRTALADCSSVPSIDVLS